MGARLKVHVLWPFIGTNVSSSDHFNTWEKSHLFLDDNTDKALKIYGREIIITDERNPHPIIKKIQKTFGKQVRFVFRNFPLQESHPDAMAAAIAAEAANLQGKFWEMHDEIYENQDALSEENLTEMAKTIGLDMSQFEKDIQNETLREKVEADFESGMRSGVNGTPAFFINGKKFDGGAEDVFDVLKESTEN